MKRFSLILLAATILVAGCNSKEQSKGGNDTPEDDSPYKVFSYAASSEDFANPERGFYYPYGFHHAGKAVSASDIKKQRDSKRTLVLLEFWLKDFMNSDISQAYLDMVAECFNNVREAGAKCVLRFGYTESENDKPWDANQTWVLRHIEQLKPVLQANSDVIFVLQAGFIGVWGEWYYTENWTNFADRKLVIDAELDALPATRQIEVRTPGYKMTLFGISQRDTLTRATAHDGSPISRIGGHNDCFVASSTDYGTYNSGTERAFWHGDTRYTIMGGETCDPNSTYCNCEKSISELERYHWTYLNSEYHKGVLNVWKDENCYSEVCLRLGYRLFVQDATVPKEIKAGEPFDITLNIENMGFAAPQNPREAYLIFKDEAGGETRLELDSDPRFWLDGQITTVVASETLPAAGTYKMYLFLPDPEPKLNANPLYAIRLANMACWDSKTGYNYLSDITVL